MQSLCFFLLHSLNHKKERQEYLKGGYMKCSVGSQLNQFQSLVKMGKKANSLRSTSLKIQQYHFHLHSVSCEIVPYKPFESTCVTFDCCKNLYFETSKKQIFSFLNSCFLLNLLAQSQLTIYGSTMVIWQGCIRNMETKYLK